MPVRLRIGIALAIAAGLAAGLAPDARERLDAVFDSARDGAPRPGGDVVGRASVIDGDTIDIGGRRIRLHGIDAPETGQTCRDPGGRSWPCGRSATRALEDLVDRRTVACDQRDIDRYGRIVARCRVGTIDINQRLVADGLAMAYRRYSCDYVADEEAARLARRGMWDGTFEPPWDWRAR
jgi:endonuclease YncB( thermonuclease family)